MGKINNLFIHNLMLIITGKCNLSCDHCIGGNRNNLKMSKQTIKNIFNQVKVIEHLGITGGEPLIDLDIVEMIFNTIEEKKILIGNYDLITNGTLYTSQVDKLFYNFEKNLKMYDVDYDYENKGSIYLSTDIYHMKEIAASPYKATYLNNIINLTNSKYFKGEEKTEVIFNEGCAKDLNIINKKEIPVSKFVIYNKKDIGYIGPMVTINPIGLVTECNASNDNQETIYNYGNINSEYLYNIINNKNPIRCRTLNSWGKNSIKEAKKYIGL